MSRGTILCRRDPKDKQEWQFSLDQDIAFKDTQQRHQMSMEASHKNEALEWIQAKKVGSLLEGSEAASLADDALSDVLPEKEKKKKKGLLALKDKESEGESGEEDDKLKAAVDEADVLSDLGKNKSKEQAAKRITKMISLLKALRSDMPKGSSGSTDTAQAKSVPAALDSLQKQAKKVSMEAAKTQLLEAVLAVKRVSKALKQ